MALRVIVDSQASLRCPPDLHNRSMSQARTRTDHILFLFEAGFYLFRNRNDPFQEWNAAPQTFFGIAPILRMVARWVVPAIPGMMVVPPL